MIDFQPRDASRRPRRPQRVRPRRIFDVPDPQRIEEQLVDLQQQVPQKVLKASWTTCCQMKHLSVDQRFFKVWIKYREHWMKVKANISNLNFKLARYLKI